MKSETAATLLALLGAASALVPQEHSHERILTAVRTALNLNNVDEVADPVFALLGNAAAAQGAGKVTDLDCLQQRVADQAFTNAKAAGDVAGQANALLYRALERNTISVGLKSVLCTSETAKNPEVAALTQHQDSASDGAAATNKQIALTLAVQLASIGADPLLAIDSGTFAPGQIGDPTAKGNSCDDLDDPEGCIFTKKLLVPDVTAAEIDAAIAGAGGAGAGAGAGAGNGTVTPPPAAGNATADGCITPPAAIVDNGAAQNGTAGKGKGNNKNKNNNKNKGKGNAADAAAGKGKGNAADAAAGKGKANNGEAAAAPAAGAGAGAATGAGTNVNKFTGTVGAPPVPIVSSASARPFDVNGSTFINIGAAAQRACDVQKNQCANAANSGAGGSVADCDAQQQQCVAANSQKRRRGHGRPAAAFATY